MARVHRCKQCFAEFVSRNQLFEHLRNEGHTVFCTQEAHMHRQTLHGLSASAEPSSSHMRLEQRHVQPGAVDGKLAFQLFNVFSPTECKKLIEAAERAGYQPALLNVGGGQQVLATGVRNGSRRMTDDAALAQRIFERIQTALPQSFAGHPLVGLNERLRFLKYEPGQYFKPHQDGTYQREDGPRRGERSYLTVLLYLNEGYTGGATTFSSMSGHHSVAVQPETGMVLVHRHDIVHESPSIEDGVKHVIRTDVMYGAAMREGIVICGDCGEAVPQHKMVTIQSSSSLKCNACAEDYAV